MALNPNLNQVVNFNPPDPEFGREQRVISEVVTVVEILFDAIVLVPELRHPNPN